MTGQGTDPALTALHEQLSAGGRCGEESAAEVDCIWLLDDETLLLEGVDDAGHGGRANLLGACEIAQGDGTGEDDDGEGGEARGVEAGGIVFAAELAEQVDGEGVDLICDLLRLR